MRSEDTVHVEIAKSLAVPGWAAATRRRNLAVVLGGAGALAPLAVALYAALSGRNRLALSLDSRFLAVVIVVGIAAIVARLVALAEVWLAAGRPSRPDRPAVAALVGAATVLAASSFLVVEVAAARGAISRAFVAAPETPMFDAAPSTTAAAPTPSPTTTSLAPPTTLAGGASGLFDPDDIDLTVTTMQALPGQPDSGVDPALLTDVTTVLLLGGDAGPGRGGLRTDSMMLFSLHQPTGRASLVSIPRDMRGLLFPPGSALEARHPQGFDDLANAVYPIVSANESLREAYAADDVRPGVVAIAQGIGYSLDVTIHDYVLVDMQGFLDLIDALGGVTVTLSKRIPMPGNIPGAPTQYPSSIGPGTVVMDGTTALGYARSRKGDSDYQRTARQRALLAALAQQISLTDVALSFGSVAAAVGGTLRTSLSPDELAETLNVIGGDTAIVESVGLVPPLVDDMRRPDFDRLAKVVGAVQLALVTGEPSGY